MTWGGIGAMVRGARYYHKLTLRDAAKAARISVSHLSQIERGIKHPSLVVLMQVARAVGINEMALLVNARDAVVYEVDRMIENYRRVYGRRLKRAYHQKPEAQRTGRPHSK